MKNDRKPQTNDAETKQKMTAKPLKMTAKTIKIKAKTIKNDTEKNTILIFVLSPKPNVRRNGLN